MAGGLRQRVRLGVGVADSGRGEPVQHGLHRVEVRCRLPVHGQFRVVREAQQACLLGPEPGHGP